MRLQQKIWLGAGAVIAVIMLADLVLGYWRIERELRHELEADARVVRGILMATRRVYHQQFLASGLPVDERTVGFLPAHALARISEQFPKWVETGLRFNNVSDRPRNPANRADRHDRAAMDWFRTHPEKQERLADIVAEDGGRYLHFTAPIWIEPYCLTCHGDRAAAPASIRDRYADAYGYKLGDLRGVMSIRLPLDDFRAKALGHWNREFGLRAGGYAVLLLLLGFMMRRLVVQPLRRLEQAAVEIGEGKSAHRVVVAGDDEVGTLGRAFNEMADKLAAHSAQIAKLNRIYATLSETNQTIVRIDDEAELLRRTCRIAIEHGGQTMAWIGRRDPESGRIVVAECAGEGIGYLDGLAISVDPADGAPLGPTARAWTTGEAVVVQDYASDPRTAPWQERAAPHGWKASAAFPILRGGVVHLVLNLYNREAASFDPKVVDLLEEMASDIGYALDRIDLIATQEATRRALVASEAKYRDVLQTTRDGFLLIDGGDRILEANQAFSAMAGYAPDELIGMRVAELAHEGTDGQAGRELRLVRERGSLVWETRQRCRDGRVKVVEISATAAQDGSGTVAAFVRDLSMRDEARERIQRLAHFDTLTGLPNRQRFTDLARQAMTQAARSGEPVAMAFIDADRFKNVNDVLGHQVGDQLLVALAGRIGSVLRAGDVLARAGGDEFLLLLPGSNAEAASHVAERVVAACTQPVAIDGHELVATCSLGIALYPADGEDFETLLRKADTATYRAKEDGRSTYRFFAPEMQAQTARTLQVEAALRRALERRELALHFQPQIELAGGRTVGIEALLRWQHPDLGAVSPGEFIPIAESSGLIIPIGDWVLETALAQLKTLRDGGLPVERVAVNLSAVQFRQARLVERVTERVVASGLPFDCLELEITESVAMADPVAAVAVLDRLHGLGVRIAIDDFGTGYSSLGYLKRFPIDSLKIDQSFVRDVTTDRDDANIVRAIVRLAESLQFGTVAEGVERDDQLAFLREAGCQEIQGYLFSRPLPAPALADWLRSRMAAGGRGDGPR